MDIVISIGLIALTYVVCDSLRRNAKSQLPAGTVRDFVLDTLISFELCIGAFELGTIFDHYGFYAWVTALFFTVLYQSLRWQDFSTPSPGVHVEAYFTGGCGSVTTVLLRTATLVASGLLSYKLISNVWALEFTATHTGRVDQMGACEVPWGTVPITVSFVSEFLGTLFLGVTIPLIAEHPFLVNNDQIYTALAISSLVVAAVVCALEVSGGMFNPMLATALLLNCKGHDLWQHVIVYWISGLLGTMASIKAFPAVRKMVYAHSVSADKKMA